MKKTLYLIIFVIGFISVSVLLIISMPQILERVTWHVEDIRGRIQYWLKPPQKVVFDPARVTEMALIAPNTENDQATATEAILSTPTLLPTPTLIPMATLTPTVSPLPKQVDLKGVKYMDQHGLYNYCAPSNLAMLLSYWGWNGDRIDIGKVIKPYTKDKNVMPYEMADYVRENTNLNVIIRVGGNLDTIKRFNAAGFPVLIEKGTYIVDIYKDLSDMVNNRLNSLKDSLTNSERSLRQLKMSFRFKEYRMSIDESSNRLKRLVNNRIVSFKTAVDSLEKVFQQINPELTLKRGYTYILRDNKTVTRSNELNVSDEVEIVFYDGKNKAIVK